MKKIFVFMLSLLSAVTFSLSSCSSNKGIFKKVEFYGYGYNETFYNEEFEQYTAVDLVMQCIFQDDYFIKNEYGIHCIYEKDLENYKSVKDYLSENKKIDYKATPSNRQILFGYYYQTHTDDNPLKYIAVYDTTIEYVVEPKNDLVAIVKFSISEMTYIQAKL